MSRPLPGPVGAVRNTVIRSSLLTVLMISVDIAAVAAATLGMPVSWALLFGGVALACRGRAHLYRRRLRLSYVDDLPREVAALLVVLGVTSGLAAVAGDVAVDVPTMTRVTLTFAALVAVPRIGVFQIARWARKRGRTDRTLVVGASGISIDLVEKMIEHPEFGLRPVGFVDTIAPHDRALPVPVVGDDMASAIVRHRIGAVVLAFPNSDPRDHFNAVVTAQRLGCTMFLVPRLYEVVHDAPDVERLRSYPMIRLSADPTTRPAWWVKRAFDLVVSTVALLLVAPVLAACALAVFLESGRPLIFKQERVGLDGRSFLIYKFRSLRPVDEFEAATKWTVAGDPRIGPVGRFLRRTSLDELPQLWNIVRGEMSLVGPRPERPGFVRQFSATHERYWARHRVPSGLTGLAQVNGLRGNTSIGDRASFDNYYIANWSFWLDIKIIVLTLREVVRHGDH
jgi:exopolysaccharide biosynthesis polyprenyl glycosylphosphotransferase